MIAASLETNLGAFNAALSQYYTLTSKTIEQVLEKKGRSLGIAIFKGFRAHKFKSGAFSSVIGTLFDKAAKLTRAEYRAGEKVSHGKSTAPVRTMELNSAFAGTIPERTIEGHQMSNWQKAVAQEAIRRKAGVGVLAVSFLWSRAKFGEHGTTYIKNKVGTPLGAVEKGEGFLKIIGFTDGLSLVDERYGVLVRAIAEETADMNAYIVKQLEELWGSTFAEFHAHV